MRINQFATIFNRRFIYYLIVSLICLQLFIFLSYLYYDRQTKQEDLKKLLLQQTMILLQRLQTHDAKTQLQRLQHIAIPNITTSITPEPKWPVQMASPALWPIYSALKKQTDPIRVSVALLSGLWFNLQIDITTDKYLLRYMMIGFELFITLALLLFLALIYYYSIPLQSITQAAKRLGIDVAAQPLLPQGSGIVKETFLAINEMQQKIKLLLQQRTQLLASISHDLRTPLTRLYLRGEYINNALQQQKYYADLEEMEVMIKQILAYAKENYETTTKKPFNLTALLISLCENYQEQGHKVNYIGLQIPLQYTGVELMCKRCFSNIIENALKYAGNVTVDLQSKTLENKQKMIITISDDGPGVAEEHMDKLFQPFYRGNALHTEKTGSGLGLAIAQNIIHAHQGTIHLQANQPHGLQVIITL